MTVLLSSSSRAPGAIPCFLAENNSPVLLLRVATTMEQCKHASRQGDTSSRCVGIWWRFHLVFPAAMRSTHPLVVYLAGRHQFPFFSSSFCPDRKRWRPARGRRRRNQSGRGCLYREKERKALKFLRFFFPTAVLIFLIARVLDRRILCPVPSVPPKSSHRRARCCCYLLSLYTTENKAFSSSSVSREDWTERCMHEGRRPLFFSFYYSLEFSLSFSFLLPNHFLLYLLFYYYSVVDLTLSASGEN